MAKEYILSEYNRNVIVPMVVETLESKIGKGNIIKSAHVINWLKACNEEITPGNFRAVINYIRSNDLVKGLIATTSGYYVSDNPEEIQEWISSYQGRIKEMARPLKRAKMYLQELNNRPALIN